MSTTTPNPAGPRGTRMAEECLAVRVRLLNRRLSRIYDGALRPVGLTVAQLNLLSLLEVVGSAPSGRIAELLAMEISTLSRNAQIMKNEGWISIEPATRGNGRILTLTDAGAQQLLAARPAWEDAQAQARVLLGNDDAILLKRIGDSVWDREVGRPRNDRAAPPGRASSEPG